MYHLVIHPPPAWPTAASELGLVVTRAGWDHYVSPPEAQPSYRLSGTHPNEQTVREARKAARRTRTARLAGVADRTSKVAGLRLRRLYDCARGGPMPNAPTRKLATLVAAAACLAGSALAANAAPGA
ncbi:MAG: hypothetical protein ACYDAQ_17970, partial [Mycobacteriales bacterium]